MTLTRNGCRIGRPPIERKTHCEDCDRRFGGDVVRGAKAVNRCGQCDKLRRTKLADAWYHTHGGKVGRVERAKPPRKPPTITGALARLGRQPGIEQWPGTEGEPPEVTCAKLIRAMCYQDNVRAGRPIKFVPNVSEMDSHKAALLLAQAMESAG